MSKRIRLQMSKSGLHSVTTPTETETHKHTHLCSSSGLLIRLKRMCSSWSLSLGSGWRQAVHRMSGMSSYNTNKHQCRCEIQINTHTCKHTRTSRGEATGHTGTQGSRIQGTTQGSPSKQRRRSESVRLGVCSKNTAIFMSSQKHGQILVEVF